MSEPAVKVIVRSGKAYARRDRMGGPYCVRSLVDDIQSLEHEWASYEGYQETNWTCLPDQCEGGYLLDFDTKEMLLYAMYDYFKVPLEEVQQAWPAWSIRFVEEGVSDFVAYLRNRSFFFEDAAVKPQNLWSGPFSLP